MKKNTKRTLTPKLRFPEFRDESGWNASNLGELTEVVRGGSPRPIDGFLTTASEGLNWLKIGDVDKEAKYVTRAAEKVRREALSKTRVVNPGDMILSNSMSFGRPYILQIETCIHDGWIAITRIAKQTDRDFLYYWILAPSSQSYFVDNAAGSGVQNLNADIIKALSVSFPSPAEQHKIADCLSSLDELIAAEGRKLEALRAHKKGLMQQLFPQPGETQPRLRFPEFRKAGGWEERKLADLLPIGSSKRVHQSDWASDGVPFYRAREIVALHNGEPISPLYISEDLYFENVTKTGAISSGDLLVTGVGSIGVPYLVTSSDRFYFKDGNIIWLKNDESAVIGRFLHLLYQTSYVQSQITKMAGVGTVGTYTIDNANRTQVIFPYELIEQHKIADCLTSLDTRITAQAAKIETLKQHKRGLMQQLFPSPDDHPAPTGHPSNGGEWEGKFPSTGGVDGEAGRGGTSTGEVDGEAGRGG